MKHALLAIASIALFASCVFSDEKDAPRSVVFEGRHAAGDTVNDGVNRPYVLWYIAVDSTKLDAIGYDPDDCTFSSKAGTAGSVNWTLPDTASNVPGGVWWGRFDPVYRPVWPPRLMIAVPRDSAFTHYRVEIDCGS